MWVIDHCHYTGWQLYIWGNTVLIQKDLTKKRQVRGRYGAASQTLAHYWQHESIYTVSLVSIGAPQNLAHTYLLTLGMKPHYHSGNVWSSASLTTAINPVGRTGDLATRKKQPASRDVPCPSNSCHLQPASQRAGLALPVYVHASLIQVHAERACVHSWKEWHSHLPESSTHGRHPWACPVVQGTCQWSTQVLERSRELMTDVVKNIRRRAPYCFLASALTETSWKV